MGGVSGCGHVTDVSRILTTCGSTLAPAAAPAVSVLGRICLTAVTDAGWTVRSDSTPAAAITHTHTHTLINIHVMSPDEYVQCVSLQRPLLVRKLPIMHWANDRWYSRFPGLRVWLTNNFISPLVSLSPAWGSERAIMTLLHHHEEFVCCCLCLVIIETAWRTTQTASVSVPQQPSINIKTYSTCVTVSGAANLMNINNWP